MLRLAADENFHGAFVRGMRRRLTALDLTRVQDAGLSGADDRTILEWAAREGRVLLSHDENTLVGHAHAMVDEGLPMAGVFIVRTATALGPVTDDLMLWVECSREHQWDGQVRYLPL